MKGRAHAPLTIAGVDVLSTMAGDRAVAGVILHGSRSVEGFAREASDYDLIVVVDDGDESARTWAVVPGLDVLTVLLSAWPQHAMAGEPDAWNRYALVHAELLYERPRSGVEPELERKRRLSTHEADRLARAALDEYVNGCYRSLKNHRDGRALEARLDGAESAGPLLTAMFAMDSRVRPYNRYLRWELEHEPLSDPELAEERFTGQLLMLIENADPDAQQALFAQTDRIARRRGHGEVIDDWGERLLVLRP